MNGENIKTFKHRQQYNFGVKLNNEYYTCHNLQMNTFPFL